jgi:Tol biopolymer transport system component
LKAAAEGIIGMRIRVSSFVVLLAVVNLLIPSISSQPDSLGLFDGHNDIGEVKRQGSVTYDSQKQEYTIKGSGANMWADRDEFHFVWKRLRGNFILTARAQFMGEGVEQHRKIGWMVRSSLDSDSTHINAAVHGDGLTSLQFRRSKGGITEEVKSDVKGADVIQLERKGNRFTMSVARFGDPFVTNQVSDLTLGDEVYAGLYVCAHNKDVVERAVFRDVQITIPASEDFVPYRDFIGSNLEILDIASGNRKVIYREPGSIQAPNWTPDGKALIYNRAGRLYRFDLARKMPAVIDTGFATSNNNDHVLSFGGKMIGISHHSKEDQNKSIIYTLPVQGGMPKRITSKGPSYLHGWSPDGKFLIYTGERSGELDIYKISADGGEEMRLTTAQGLDDGPEYSPDGRFIYFNSTRGGTMQIWRMKPDGSDQQQITRDEFNNWFPHISPDGRWIVFLSFLRDVAPNDHPFYKQVYLRLMSVEGSKPRVLAYVYGGQGTINVPSWSPDNKRVAFVSNTVMK